MWLLIIVKFLWQLPQNILGLLVIFATMAIYSKDNDVWLAGDLNKSWAGVSLGSYIIFAHPMYSMNDLKHERGHQKQSLYLGWLYLLLIGLPSLIGNLLHRVLKFDYYKQPWEKWADKFGGVDRSKHEDRL